jgi:hypothetical protein
MTVADKTKPQGTRGPVHHRSLDTGHFALETHSEVATAAMRGFLEGPRLREGA